MTTVSWYLARPLFPTISPAEMERSIGTNVLHTGRFLTRVVRMATDLIEERLIYVLDSSRKESCSGLSCFSCHLDLQL
jgi:hypothetical protein